MIYEIEDNLDFFSLLNDDDSNYNDDYDDICLITHEKLTENYIILDCKHKFNYYSLYKEIYNQKNDFNKFFDINKLKINEIKCPYCRSTSEKLLPYIPYKNVKKIYGVNAPERLCMKSNYNCCWIFKSGKNKNSNCNVNSYILNGNNFCHFHHNKNNTIKNQNNNLIIMEDNKDNKDNKDNYDEYLKKYKLQHLKNILRENKLHISGNKKTLIHRILFNKIKI